MKPVRILALVLALAALATSCSPTSQRGRPEPLRVGAIYPLSGTQGPGGVEECRGVRLAAELANASGGVAGRPIELAPVDVPEADAAPGAVGPLPAAASAWCSAATAAPSPSPPPAPPPSAGWSSGRTAQWVS